MSEELKTLETEVEFNVSQTAIRELKRLIAEEKEQDLYLRIGVMPGGCSGMSYNMGFDDQKTDFDTEFNFENVRVLIDEATMLYINGATLDFDKKLMGGGFTFKNPNAKKSCGCGTSFRC